MEQNSRNNAPPPASEEQIERLPSIQVKISELGEHTECAICQEEYQEEETVKKMPCLHLFHPHCIDSWLRVNGTCPICRFGLQRSEGGDAQVLLRVREVLAHDAASVIAGQLVRAGTSIGANYREANRAESRDDFVHQTAIAHKEASETVYWLDLCERTDLGDKNLLQDLRQEAVEPLAIFSTINRRAKGR